MQVEHGMRFELRLAQESAEGVRFQLSVRVPDAELVGEAEIVGPNGSIQFHFGGSQPPPEWCLAIVRASLRTLFRERATRGSYPARIARWRPQPQAPGDETS
jgi:hypothetical protein